ncbi:hypothetical protein QX249_13495 [Vibrio parahaemolyticus]|uniref:Uncharacterized protein n=1 Tax=Vibrio parahaemolyticus TaxID=670 RepID=A0AAW8PZG7_VIBPH|nr:hypothetical protein [Vibrio parahaemolyticus]MDS1821667.1 hypothetical protein [Vibrio parahaemolyticus]
MDNKLFDELCTSMQQAKEIKDGKMAPSRVVTKQALEVDDEQKEESES